MRLSVSGAIGDIERLAGRLRPGMPATFYNEDFEVQGILEYDEAHEMWLGVADWNTWKDLC